MTSNNGIYNNGNNPYLHLSPHVPASGPSGTVCDMLNRCGKKVEDATRRAETIADNVWHHLRVSSRLTDAAVARITQGTKVLAEGGHEKVFQREFQMLPGEKLVNTYGCYLSTSTGPVIGTLYISSKRMAFCSDSPLCYYSSSGQQEWMYYKVLVDLDQLRSVNPSANRLNPSDKYIHIVTRDGYEFWFMGFISYDKALKTLTEALPSQHS